MKIVDIRVTAVSIPVTRAAVMTFGMPSERVTRTIIEVECDNGLVGLGETSAGPCADILTSEIAPALIGLDPREMRTARRHCLPDAIDYGTPLLALTREAFGGLEVALWDVLAKSLDLPLFRLLGGPVREQAPFVAYAYSVAACEIMPESAVPAAMAEYAKELLAQSGAHTLEMKIGPNSLECEVETIRAVRHAVGPAVDLALDANMGLTPDQAAQLMRSVLEERIANFEEPVESLADLARFRRQYAVPVSTHCDDLDALAHHPEIDGVVVDINTQGGIQATIELARNLRLLGRRCWLRSFPETGVLWAAMVHLGMAMPELDRPGQALIETMTDDLIEGDVWLVKNGGVRPPELPGLGVTLDREAVTRHHAEYAKLGFQKTFSPALGR